MTTTDIPPTTDVPPPGGPPTGEPTSPPTDTPPGCGPEAGQPETSGPESSGPESSKPESSKPEAGAPDEHELSVSVGGVDPRMRDRWIEARRAEGRRRLRALLAVLIVLSLVGIGYLVASSPLLGVDTVTVQGAVTMTPSEVRRVARVKSGEPLLFLDTAALARRVEALPAVDTAHVETELPNTVLITITERRPVGFVRVAGPGPIAIVDGRGRVIGRVDQAPPGLPQVVGAGPMAPLGESMTAAGAFRGLAKLSPELRLAMDRFIIRDGGEGIARLVGTAPPARLIRFGAMRDMRRKAAAATAVIDDLARRGQSVRWLDVAVPTAPVTR